MSALKLRGLSSGFRFRDLLLMGFLRSHTLRLGLSGSFRSGLGL